MGLSAADASLIAAVQGGLPLAPHPYAAVAEAIGTSEAAVLERLRALRESGAIKRHGLVVRHAALGYGANAMVVFDLPDAEVDTRAARIAALPFVTLCYRRPRRPPAWPYNLFAMIHGRRREQVLAQVATLRVTAGIEDRPHAVLFSRRAFKQRGARYAAARAGA